MATPAGRSRRRFLSTVGLATAGLTIVPRHVLGRGFQAPSDRLNIADVGVGGRGRAVDHQHGGREPGRDVRRRLGLCRPGLRRRPPDIGKLEERIAENIVEVRAPASARNEGAPPTVTTRPMTPLERSRAIGYAGRQRELIARGAEGRSLPGLPPDARPAEGHRRGGRGHARSPARRPSRWRRWTWASTSTSRSRCAGRWPRRGSWPSAPPRPRWRRRWAIRATRPTTGAWSWSTCRPAPLAT